MAIPLDKAARRQLLASTGFRLYADRNFWIDPFAKKIVVGRYAETCPLEELQAFLEKENASGTWDVFAETVMEGRAIREAIAKVMS